MGNEYDLLKWHLVVELSTFESVCKVVGRFANVQFSNLLRRFANVFSPILMAHCMHIDLQNSFHFKV